MLIRCKKDGLILDVCENKTLQIGKDRVFLSHFPYREWGGYHKGSYHLYGHCHGNIDDYKQSTDIGVDCWECEPVSWEEVKQYIDANCEPNV
jgi:calcineurin-like phosphoesterase family protein